MRFDIITLFPEAVEGYLNTSILARAQKEKYIEVYVHQLRSYAIDKHKTVDDTPYGGGAGMVLKVEPLTACLREVLSMSEIERERTRVLVTSAKGRVFTQARARNFSEVYERIVLVCGRYEGIDQRFIDAFCDEEISVGEFVLTGGELPALIVTDAVTRLLPGVLGNAESAVTESFTEEHVLEHPQYTKPEEFEGMRVPEVLLSGHHKNIDDWRNATRQKKEIV